MDYQTIYENIKDSFEAQSGYQVQEDSDLGIRMRVFAGEIFNLDQQLEECEKQMFPQTATGVYLARHGQCRDIVKKEAKAASGVLRFSRGSAASQDIVIPAGTICSSSSGGGMMYLTQEEGVLTAGTRSTDVAAMASAVGVDGNILAGKIDTIVSTIAGVDEVTNPENFSGGREDEEDEVFRKRLLESYLNVSNGANLKFYTDFAMLHPDITSAKAVVSSTGNTISLYVSDFFRLTSQTAVDEIQEDISSARELNVNVRVIAATPVEQDVTMVAYVQNMQNYSTKMSAVVNYIRDRMYYLGVGEPFNPYSICSGVAEAVDGVLSVAFTSPTTISPVSANQIIKPGNVTVALERE